MTGIYFIDPEMTKSKVDLREIWTQCKDERKQLCILPNVLMFLPTATKQMALDIFSKDQKKKIDTLNPKYKTTIWLILIVINLKAQKPHD